MEGLTFSTVLQVAGGFVGVCLIMVVFLLPSIIAWYRGHLQQNKILWANLFLGWTVIGWIVIFAWALGPYAIGRK